MWNTKEYLPAGPRLPATVQTVAWGVRPVEFGNWCARRYGTPYTIRLLGMGSAIVEFSDPGSIGEIFALDADDFSAGDATRDVLGAFLGPNSILVLDGEEHRRERRVVMRSFHAEKFAEHERTIEDCTRTALAAWPRGRPFATLEATQALTLEVILRTIFGIDDRDRLDDLLAPLREFLHLGGSLLILAPQLRTTVVARRKWRRFTELRREIDVAITELIEKRRTESRADAADILSALVDATDDEGEPLADEMVRDHLLTLLLAGHDTTGTSLAWAFDLLAHAPAVADRLAAEVRAGDDRYLGAVVKEVLRMRPIIPEVSRTLVRPATIGGWEVPAGAGVAANVHLAHHRRDSFPLADEFRPERFLDGATHQVHEWIPFGGGIRRCIGLAFATMEMRTVLRTVVSEVTIRPVRTRLERPRRRAVTVIPRHGAPVVLEARA